MVVHPDVVYLYLGRILEVIVTGTGSLHVVCLPYRYVLMLSTEALQVEPTRTVRTIDG